MNGFEQALERYLDKRQLGKIRLAKIGIAGAGGLGSNCAVTLVRTGFCRLKIVDCDVVDYSNLNRQFYFGGQVGFAKVEALKENLCLINPAADIEIARVRIDVDNVSDLFAECDVVV